MRRVISMLLALMTGDSALAETLELSEYFGGDIAAAAEAIGGLEYAAGEEFTDNYTGKEVVLRGQDGLVTCIELTEVPGAYTLCGVAAGMARDEVLALMESRPQLWIYDEEVAWTVVSDEENRLLDRVLTVFFDEDGRVSGAWYRTGM